MENLAAYLMGLGHDVMIITNKYPRTISSSERYRGIIIKREYFLGYGPELTAGRSFFYCFFVNVIRFVTDLKIFFWLALFSPTVVNCHYLGAVCEQVQKNTYFRFFKTPIITSLHGGDVDGEPYLSEYNKKRFWATLSISAGITCCSEYLAQQAKELSPSIINKIKVIHNGISVKEINQLPIHRFKRPTIIAVGQLVPHKGMDLLIQAFNKLPPEIDADLCIIGEGDEYHRLSEMVRSSVTKEKILLVGSKNNVDVISWMKGSVCVVVPSLREPFGLVVLEAIAAGCQVIASNVGGIPEFLNCPPNLLIDRSVDAITTALKEVFTIDASEIEINRLINFEHAKTFDWTVIVEDYLQLYRKVIRS